MAERDPLPNPKEYGLSIRELHGLRDDGQPILMRHATKKYERRIPKDKTQDKKERDRRARNTIRYLIIHHHGGATHPTRADAEGKTRDVKGPFQDTDGVPRALKATAEVFVKERKWPGYAYQYDVGHFADKVLEQGVVLNVVYQTQKLEIWSNHTSAGKNEHGIGISMVGCRRCQDKIFGTDTLLGVPSEFQIKAIESLVKYLQDRFGIASCHVWGHFQHGKPSCPGYDMERWVIDHEGRTFRCCYPVALGKGGTAPFLGGSGKDGQFSAYMKNTVQEGATGFYPYNRRRFWHNGVHLYPPGGKGSPVCAVRDGWVVAARVLGGEVKIGERVRGKDVERNYGSCCFVLVRHEDPGIKTREARSCRKAGDAHLINHLHYYSLYMHLDEMKGGVSWLDTLKRCDKKSYDRLVAPAKDSSGKPVSWGKPMVFKDVALPVKAGELIGKVGLHNPFAMRCEGSSKATQLQPTLHFEIFSPYNLLQLVDPDPKLHERWLIVDNDTNPRVEERLRLPKTITALTNEMRKKIKELRDQADDTDPRCLEPDLVPQRDPSLNEIFSAMVCRHISEWETDWGSVLAEWKKKSHQKNAVWRITDDQIAHHQKVVAVFQWIRQLDAKARAALRALVPAPGLTCGITANAKLFYYHPIRFLNWLNGLEKKLSVEMDYNNFDKDECGKNPFPVGAVAATAAAKGSKSVRVVADKTVKNKKTGVKTPVGLPEAFLKGAKLIFQSGACKGKRYTITVGKEVLGTDKRPTAVRELTLDRPLDEKVTPGDRVIIRHYDKGYGWHWKARFPWATRP